MLVPRIGGCGQTWEHISECSQHLPQKRKQFWFFNLEPQLKLKPPVLIIRLLPEGGICGLTVLLAKNQVQDSPESSVSGSLWLWDKPCFLPTEWQTDDA